MGSVERNCGERGIRLRRLFIDYQIFVGLSVMRSRIWRKAKNVDDFVSEKIRNKLHNLFPKQSIRITRVMFVFRNYCKIFHQPLRNNEPVERIPVMKVQGDDFLQMLEVYRENFDVVCGKKVDYVVEIRLQFQLLQAEFYGYLPNASDTDITLVIGILYRVERPLR